MESFDFIDLDTDFSDLDIEECPVTLRAPVAQLAGLVAQTNPPPARRPSPSKPVIEELSPDDFFLEE